jgi:hypothetical protein
MATIDFNASARSSIVLLLLPTAALLALLWLAIYRLFLHPLAKVPGPKLAAFTSWHEFYYDCIKGGGGQHAFKMREMHDTYGMNICLWRRRGTICR